MPFYLVLSHRMQEITKLQFCATEGKDLQSLRSLGVTHV